MAKPSDESKDLEAVGFTERIHELPVVGRRAAQFRRMCEPLVPTEDDSTVRRAAKQVVRGSLLVGGTGVAGGGLALIIY